jgi:hypothetical protein
MKKLAIAIICLTCATGLTVSAAPGKKKLTEEQKSARKELLEKYDANKDGKLDKEERAKISKEDKAKLSQAFPHKNKKREDKAAK